jgi:D-3-phosphoglycerate dehydrogenase
MKPKVVRTDSELECPHLDTSLRARNVELVLLPDGVPEQELARQVQDAEILLMCYTPVTARVIEGAFTLLLALAKRLAPMHEAMRQQGWFWPSASWLASDIAGKTVGLVGVGRIGRSMAQMAGAGFQARVLGFDPNVSGDEMRAAGVEKRADLHAMLAECDFVSIHCVLNDATRGLIGKREFECMKPGTVLINVSRGAIVDEPALLRALKERHLGGAGLDVYSNEPLARAGHPLSALFEMNNVILTPHLTFFTHEAMRRLEEEALQRCDELLSGQPVLVKSSDPRLTAQQHGVRFA